MIDIIIYLHFFYNYCKKQKIKKKHTFLNKSCILLNVAIKKQVCKDNIIGMKYF